jgi:hypothetical protein
MLDETLLHWENLTRLVNDYKPQGTPLIDSGLFSKAPIEGQSAVIDIIKVNRTKAHSTGKRSPSKTIAPEVIKRQPLTLSRAFENVPLPGSTLLNLRNPGSFNLQKIAADQVAREVKKMGRRIDYRNEFYMASALQGSITDTIDGVSFTADYMFPASHKITIGGNELSNDSFGTAWDDTGAKISFDVTKLRQKAREDSGFEIDTIIAGPEVMDALINNELVSTYLRSTQEGIAFMKSGFRGELFGVKWMEYGAGYKDDSDVFQRFLPEGVICAIPAADPLLAELLSGDDVIPTPNKMDVQSINGRYSYASITDDPAGIKLFAGEVSLPVIYVPGAFFTATVL